MTPCSTRDGDIKIAALKILRDNTYDKINKKKKRNYGKNSISILRARSNTVKIPPARV